MKYGLKHQLAAIVAATAAGITLTSCDGLLVTVGSGAPTSTTNPTSSSPGTPTTEPAPHDPSGAVYLDFDNLPRGTTGLYWWDTKNKIMHEGDIEYQLESDPTMFAAANSGGDVVFAMVTGNGDEAETSRVDLVVPGNSRQLADRIPSGIVASEDGLRLAWSSYAEDGTGTIVWLAAADTGKIIAKGEIPRASVHVAGFVGDRVVLSPSGRGMQAAMIWDPAAGSPADIKNVEIVETTSPGAGLVALVLGKKEGAAEPTPCSTVVAVDDQNREVWRSCEQNAIALSTDGRYAVTEPVDGDPASYTVVDLSNDRSILMITADRLNQPVWEDDGQHVVVDAHVNGKSALVRCDLNGTCELVTDPVPYDIDDSEAEAPYVLETR